MVLGAQTHRDATAPSDGCHWVVTPALDGVWPPSIDEIAAGAGLRTVVVLLDAGVGSALGWTARNLLAALTVTLGVGGEVELLALRQSSRGMSCVCPVSCISCVSRHSSDHYL